MRWSRAHTLTAGVALILAVNIIALAAVAYNRSEALSSLKLSERELRPDQAFFFHGENSGMPLRLQWRMLTNASRSAAFDSGYATFGGEPEWLDRAKLEELGMDAFRTRTHRRYETLSREVLLVLELDGPAYQQSLDLARERVARQEARVANAPGDKGVQGALETVRRNLRFEEQTASRLFIVDAGLDAAALRAKYPDRSRYAMVYGRVQPRLGVEGNDVKAGGYIEGLSIDRLHVPLGLPQTLEGIPVVAPYRESQPGPRYELEVAFGKRFEPWLIGAQRK